MNTTYTISLAAVGSGGVGPAYTVNVTTLEPGTLKLNDCIFVFINLFIVVPSKPAPPHYSQFGRTTIDLIWYAPSDNGGLDLEEYHLQMVNGSGPWIDLVKNYSLSYP